MACRPSTSARTGQRCPVHAIANWMLLVGVYKGYLVGFALSGALGSRFVGCGLEALSQALHLHSHRSRHDAIHASCKSTIFALVTSQEGGHMCRRSNTSCNTSSATRAGARSTCAAACWRPSSVFLLSSSCHARRKKARSSRKQASSCRHHPHRRKPWQNATASHRRCAPPSHLLGVALLLGEATEEGVMSGCGSGC